MNTSNNTTSFVATALNQYVNYIDFAVRSYDLVIHIIYFSYILLKKNCELRSRTYLFLHNINISTLAISLVYVAYINNRSPSFANDTLNSVLCELTELFWSLIKYARVFSLLLLAVYRFIGCFYVRIFKKINSKLVYIYGLISISWIISLIIPIIFKFSLDTTHSIYYCTDGFAPQRINYSIAYYVINAFLSSILPTVLITLLYVKIYKKFKSQTQKTTRSVAENNRKLSRFAQQFIMINVITAFATAFATFIDFVNVIAVSSRIQFRYIYAFIKIIISV